MTAGNLRDLVSQMTLPELEALIYFARLLVECDVAPTTATRVRIENVDRAIREYADGVGELLDAPALH